MLKSIATDKELFQPKSIDILLSFLQKKQTNKNVHHLIHGNARADCVRMCQLSEYSEIRILHVVVAFFYVYHCDSFGFLCL